MRTSSTPNMPRISIVIPAKNGMPVIRSCLEGIHSQTLAGQTEVIVIDSGSEDGTLEIAREYGARIHQIPPEKFNHGSTRNLGVTLAKGEFVVMTVQDAAFSDNQCLEKMIRHFDDPKVAGVCGQQIVGHDRDKNPLQWFNPQGDPDIIKYRFEDPETFKKLPGKEQHTFCRWDDVIAMYRKEVLEKVPFFHISFGEDTLWAREALSKGYALVYDYSARVYHYHHQDFTFYFRRTFIIHYQTYKFYNYIYYSGYLVRQLGVMTYRIFRKKLSAHEKWYWWKYNLNIQLARCYATNMFYLISKFRGMPGIEKTLKKKVGLPPQGVQNSIKTDKNE